jgi:hypothetical protein
MDAKGAAVIPYSPWDAFEPAFAALTAPLLPVTSAFALRYNTILNLWAPGNIGRLRVAVAASLREFQRRGQRHNRRHDIEYDLEAVRGRHGKTRERDRASESGGGLSRAAVAELYATIAVLRSLGYIAADETLTVKGRLLRALFHPAGIVMADLAVNGALEGLTAAEVAEVASWFTFDDDRPLRNSNQLPQRLIAARREVYASLRRVATIEYEEGLALTTGIVDSFHGVALNWSRGFTLSGLLRRIDLAEGDLLVTLNQTIDLLQQLQGAVGQALDAGDLWRDADPETRRGRYLIEARARLGRLRPMLDTAWRAMLRGSVAQSRAIPSMTAPAAEVPDLPALPMAEDEEGDVARSDRTDDLTAAPGAEPTEL